ncbi:MAG: hypothetical protein LBM87_05525 [Ruminococcus sp.]|jgi:hypothetical protein|nr:hypothetical protein [Ruminococcus sp.]
MNIKDYKSELEKIHFSPDFKEKTRQKLISEREINVSVKTPPIRMVRNFALAAAACFICFVGVKTLSETIGIANETAPEITSITSTTAPTYTDTSVIYAAPPETFSGNAAEQAPAAALAPSPAAEVADEIESEDAAFDDILGFQIEYSNSDAGDSEDTGGVFEEEAAAEEDSPVEYPQGEAAIEDDAAVDEDTVEEAAGEEEWDTGGIITTTYINAEGVAEGTVIIPDYDDSALFGLDNLTDITAVLHMNDERIEIKPADAAALCKDIFAASKGNVFNAPHVLLTQEICRLDILNPEGLSLRYTLTIATAESGTPCYIAIENFTGKENVIGFFETGAEYWAEEFKAIQNQ